MKPLIIALLFLCAMAAAAVARGQGVPQSCPNGNCVRPVPVDAYHEFRGPLLGKRVNWQAGQSRGSFRRGPLGIWSSKTYRK